MSKWLAEWGLDTMVVAATLPFLQLDTACPKEEEPRHRISAPQPIQDGWSHLGCQTSRAPLWSQLWRPAMFGAPAPLNPPPNGCASSSLYTVHRSLHRPHSPSFPSRAHHLILIKHAELMLHKSRPVGINIIPLISSSPLACSASPWLWPAFVSGRATHCIWKCYCN